MKAKKIIDLDENLSKQVYEEYASYFIGKKEAYFALDADDDIALCSSEPEFEDDDENCVTFDTFETWVDNYEPLYQNLKAVVKEPGVGYRAKF